VNPHWASANDRLQAAWSFALRLGGGGKSPHVCCVSAMLAVCDGLSAEAVAALCADRLVAFLLAVRRLRAGPLRTPPKRPRDRGRGRLDCAPCVGQERACPTRSCSSGRRTGWKCNRSRHCGGAVTLVVGCSAPVVLLEWDQGPDRTTPHAALSPSRFAVAHRFSFQAPCDCRTVGLFCRRS